MLKQICNVQAKSPMATQQQVLNALEETTVHDQEKLRRMVDYDILPEIELRLHSLIKDINQTFDELQKINEEIPEAPTNSTGTQEKAPEEIGDLDIVQRT